jgi:excisionase family DNA binding protein
VSDPEKVAADGPVGVAEAREFVGGGRSHLYVLMGRGELSFARLGRRRVIPRAELRAWIARNLAGGGPTGGAEVK